MYSPLVGRALDPMTEIVTFNGAQEGIASILASLVEPVRTATASASSASDNQE
jgi:aspartate/methionine/tyrosine aminotransferase